MLKKSHSQPGAFVGRTLRAVSVATLSLCLVMGAWGQARPEPKVVLSQMEVPQVLQSSVLIGHADPNQVLHLSISLPAADPVGLQAFADDVSNPDSPSYGHFLTPDQVGTRFGQPIQNVKQVVSYLTAKGLKVNLISPNHMALLVEGTVAQVEAAFGTTISNFKALPGSGYGRTNYYSFQDPIQVPSSLAPLILHVGGLENHTMPHPLFHRSKKKQSGGFLSVNQGRTLYSTAPMFNAGVQGQGRTIAISNWDGFQLSNVPLLYSTYSLPRPAGGVGSNISVVTVQGGSQNSSPQGEGDLDIQWCSEPLPCATSSSMTVAAMRSAF